MGGRGAAWTVGALAALTTALALSLLVGSNPLAPATLLDTLLGGGDAESRFVVWDQRLPRTVAGLVAGAALGVAGGLMQAFTRNALADPGILGVNAGAAFAVAVAVAFVGVTTPAGYVWWALLGALALTLVVYRVGAGGSSPVRLTVTGVAFGAVLAGLTTGITLTHPDAFDRMRGWQAGTLLERGYDVSLTMLPFVLGGLALALLAAPALNSVALGADVARAQGVDVRRVPALVLAAVTLLAGAATAVAGPIGFVGLMVPHLVRWTLGTDQRRILLGSLLLAPTLVVLADVVGRVAVSPSEMPAGLVLAFLGAPVLIALVRRRRAVGL